MNTTLFRRTLAALVATFAAGSAIAAADPVLVLGKQAAADPVYAFAVESRALCVRFAVVLTEHAMQVGPVNGCPGCRTRDLS